LDVYRHLLPRYFPAADKYDQELLSIEQQEDANEEGNAAVKEEEKDELQESEGEGKATENSNKEEEESAGLFGLWTPKRYCFVCAL